MILRTFEAIVDDYIRRWRDRAARENRWFEIQKSLTDAVSRAGMAQSPSGKRLSHQRRIPGTILRGWTEELLARATQLQAAKSFHELYSIVADCRIAGIGTLTVYDTAQRIGIFLKLEPERVYLHAGTREGASALGFANLDSLSPADLPDAFKRLSPAEIEDCLCIYKDHLRLVNAT